MATQIVPWLGGAGAFCRKERKSAMYFNAYTNLNAACIYTSSENLQPGSRTSTSTAVVGVAINFTNMEMIVKTGVPVSVYDFAADGFQTCNHEIESWTLYHLSYSFSRSGTCTVVEPLVKKMLASKKS